MLKKLTLSTLEETKLKPLFDTAMAEVLHSLCHEADIQGDRRIDISMTFKPKDGYVATIMKCKHTVPGREVSSLAKLEDDKTLNIDTVSNDVRQPDLLESTGVTPITAAPSARREGQA